MSSVIQFSDEAHERFSEFRLMIGRALADPSIRDTFESLSTFIQQPAALKASLLLLKAAKNESLLAKPSPRTLLAAFMVALYPVDILEVAESDLQALTEERALDRECFAAAKEVMTRVEDGTDLIAFLSSLDRFQAKFAEWKEYDRKRILLNLANIHHQWTASLEHLERSRADTRDPESLQIMIDSVQRQIDANRRRIMQMGGPEAWDQVLATPPIPVDLEAIIQEVGSKKYWDEFADELRTGRYDRVIVLLVEIRDRLKQLIPNRSDMQAEIDRALDIDFIRQLIHFESFDGVAFLTIFDVIWNQIKMFGSASAESEWTEWRDKILAQAQQATYDVLLPEIFNRFLRQLDIIEDQTQRYREMMTRGGHPIPAPSSS
jgi:hypothetical protein